MERDLFAEIESGRDQQPAQRDLFAELDAKPAPQKAAPRQTAPEPQQPSRGLGAWISDTWQSASDAMQPLREAVGYDPEAARLEQARAADRIRQRQAADLAEQSGPLDRIGDFFTRGEVAMDAGMQRLASAIETDPVRRQDAIDAARAGEVIARTPIQGETTWEDVKGNWWNAPKFVLEQGVASLPQMALSAMGPGVLVNFGSNTGQIAQSRAEADGRKDATGRDAAFAAPFSAASTALDVVGLGSVMGNAGKTAAGRIAVAAGTEGVTETAQGAIEYTGGAFGTQQGMNGRDLFENMLQSGLVGAGVGGGLRTGIETGASAPAAAIRGARTFAGALRRDPGPGLREQSEAAAASTITPEDEASPLDTADIVAGRAELIRADAGKAADEALAGGNMPAVGKRVVVTMPNGATSTGVMSDAFTNEDGSGVVIDLDGGGKLREYTDTLADAGVTISELSPTAEADAIDAQLAARAQDALAPSEGLPLPAVDAGQQQGAAPSRTEGAAPTTGTPLHFGIVTRLQERGLSEAAARGVAAGIHAESRSDARAVNPTSGAMGVGQWLGSRKKELVKRYGANPTLDQQLDFLVWELNGGDHGGKAVLAGRDENAVLEAYITKFMRPAKGAETDGDLARGRAALGSPLVAGSAPAVIDAAEGIALPEREAVDFGAVAKIEGAPREDDGTTEETAGTDLRGPDLDAEWVRFAETSGTRNVPRAEMPQIKAEHRGAMVQFLKARGVTHQEMIVPASTLKPTQAEFSPAKVQAAKDYKGGDRAILISNDGYVLDGHHQWLGARDGGGEVRTIRLDAPIAELIPLAHEFPSSTQAQETDAPAIAGADTEAAAKTPADASSVTESAVRVEETPSGKGLAVVGASEADLAAIAAAAPKARAVRRADGAMVYSAKYADAIRAAVAGEATRAQQEQDPALTPDERTALERLLASDRKGGEGWSKDSAAYQQAKSIIEAGRTRDAADENLLVRALRLRDAAERAKPPQNDDANGLAADQPESETVSPKVAPSLAVSDQASIDLLSRMAENEDDGKITPFDSATLRAKMLIDGGYVVENKGGKTGAMWITSEKGRAVLDRAGVRHAQSPTSTPTSTPTTPAQGGDKPSSYGISNKVFTSDAAERARALLRAKRDQLNSGFDPEIAQAGLTLMGYHIEAGARQFIDAARAVATDLGMTPTDLRRSLRSWYNSARDWMEDNGHDIRGMDDDAAVKVDLSRIEQWGSEQTTPTAQGATGDVDAELPNDLSERDAGPGSRDVQGTSPNGRDGSASQSQDGRSPDDLPRPDQGREDAAERDNRGSGNREGRDRASLRDVDRVPAAKRDAGSRTGPARDAAQAVKGRDWIIEPGSLDESRPALQKARDNVDAIALVKQIEAEGRPATKAEQAVIARYVGWGGLKNVFPDTNGAFGKGFEQLGPRLRELLSDAEYETARRSIQYAHYTSEKVVRPMWDIARELGFTGGMVFEPGMGTGNFRGMMPADLAASSRYQGIEYDHLTASIAKLLYPQSGVRQADYTTMPGLKGVADLVIGNPPFSETAISADPEYAKHKFLLHDFFFAKSLDALKPGGLLMFVTSAGTMNKRDAKARQYLADRADLVGAIRLPGNAFEENAGTSVTTDIVILRKRMPGEAAADQGWVATDTRTLPTRDGGTHTGAVSQYFNQHPEMVLGEESFFDKLVAGPRYAVRAPKGFDLEAAIRTAADTLTGAVVTTTPSAEPVGAADVDLTSTERKDGSYYLDDSGRLMQYRGGVGAPVQSQGKGVQGGMSKAAQERVRALVPIKEALREVYAADLKSDGAAGDAARQKLNVTYDAFVQKFGPINKTDISYRKPSRVEIEGLRAAAREEARLAGAEWDDGSFDVQPMLDDGLSMAEIARAREEARDAAKAAGRIWNEGTFEPEDVPEKVVEKRPNLDPFMDDEEGYRLAAIEHYNKDTGESAKGRVFFENAVKLDAAPKIDSAQDALLYSLNRLGRPDIGMIADMAGMSRDAVMEELGERLFEVPEQRGVHETGEMYLSGNVREKLAAAREAAERDPAFDRNVRALEAVMPKPLTPSEITANLGMPWIPADVVRSFMLDKMELRTANVSYLGKLAQWLVTGDKASSAATSTWGTDRMDAVDLMLAALNRQTPIVRDRIRTAEGDKSIVNEVATQAAQDKMAEIKEAFRSWVWNDDTRAANLVDLYNRDYNSHVAPSFNGFYLTTPGIASTWQWRPHQTTVVARIIQSGNTYMAHEVGAGKTSAMIGAGMEMKRLGLVSKPMYVVPNHMLGQFTKEFYEQYPLARIRVADERRFHTSRRKEFVARMAADDLDAVIITHSAFGYIPMSDDFTAGMVEQQIDDLEDLLKELGKGQDVRITRRKVEQQKEALEQRLRGLTNRKRDQVFTFEETGVDFLFVDEAHEFRKLDFATRMGDVKGIDPQGSQKSFDLFAKTRYLEQQRPGRNLVLASGTPITNTMAELYSVSRYLQGAELEKRGLGHFDAWAGAFGDTVTALEQDPAGGYKPQTRFAKFINVPELSVMVRQVMDVVGATELRQYVSLPNLKGGSRQLVSVEMTENQAAYKGTLQRRMEAIQRRSGPPQKGDDILLSVIGDGRKAAIDYRLIDSTAPREEGSKLERMIQEVARRHKEFSRTPFHAPLPAGAGFSEKAETYGPATQMIFSDFGINGDFPVHKYIRSSLIERGIPAGQIAIISDFKTHVAKQRLFNDMNEGKVRVLIGSVAKMGTGVNAQRRLRALHNMDAQWYPANDTQRNGRIIRQGNMNPEIEILDYATEGTYDSTMWGLMAKKARFIEGFMRGDPTMRDMEDLGEASQYEQVSAMTTSDPRIMELTEWEQELEKIERRKAAHERDQQNIRLEIMQAEERAASTSARIPLIEQDIAARNLPENDAFTGVVRGRTYDDKAEFGAALMDAAEDITGRANGKTLREGVGEFGGFKIAAESHPGMDGTEASFYIKRAGGRESRVDMGSDARGLVTRITNVLRRFDEDLDWARSSVEAAERRMADFRPKLGAKFDDGGKGADLREKINGLEAALAAESAAAEAARKAAPGEARQSIPEADLPVVAELTGSELGKLLPPGRARITMLRDRAIAWFAQNLRGKTITASDGKPVAFTKRGQAKSTSRKGDEVLRIVPAIPDLISKGVVRPMEQRLLPNGIVKSEMFAGIVMLDGKPVRAGAIVLTDNSGSRHYDLTNEVRSATGNPGEPGGATDKSSVPSLDGEPGGDWNLIPISEDFNAAREGLDEAALAEQLQQRLEGYGLGRKVALRVVETLNGAAGDYRAALIRIATDTSQDGTFTLDHEAVHAFRDLGVFNNSEWAVLAAKARRDTGLMRSIRQRYPRLDAEAQVEEAVGDMFARWRRGDYRAEGTVARVFKRLGEMIEAIGNWLAGRGARTSEGVMEDMAGGDVGVREGRAASAEADARHAIPERTAMIELGGSDPTWRSKMSDAFDRWRTAVQDRYLPLLKVQREIERATGKPLPVNRNPYLGEELMTGRIGAALEQLTDRHVGPLFDAMHAESITADELETYLYARHAPERNERIASINPEFEQGEGSGMTDIEAMAVMNRIEREGRTEAMERLAARVDAIREMTLNKQVETGLISQEQADELRATYEHYIPLRGFAEMGEDADPALADRINRSGGGINVRGRESKPAYGRRSKADSPLAYLILQAESAIVRGETNLVAQKFVNLAKANPDDEFWSVNKVSHRQRVNEETGLVERYLTRNLLAADADWTVSAKFGGVERRVTMNRANPAARRLADAMRNLTQQQLDWVTLHLGKVNRFLSAVNTSYNPEFVITNAFRDLQTAAFNLSGEEVEGLTRGVLKDYRAALVASTKGAFGRGEGEWGRWYEEFASEGGRVYFNRVENVAEIKKRIEKTIALASVKAGDGSARLRAKRVFMAVRDGIEGVNSGIENAVRLSTYKNARERGLSRERAASLAKNVTVNFNRRGTMGPAINAAYLFFNASVQGTARIAMALRSKRVRKMMAGVMIAGAVTEMLNAMASGDDDDGESFYDKIPAYEKSRNIILMLPGGEDYIKVPMPYGYNVFWGAGRSTAEIARRGGARWQETFGEFVATAVDAFNPIGGADSLLNMIAPTVVDPVVDLTLNRDFTGRPIMPDQPAYEPEIPDNQRYWGSVGPHWKGITDFLTTASGGDAVVPGAIDVSPETLEYLSGVAMGAAGAFIDRVIGLGGKAVDPSADITANDLPFARKLYGTKSAWYDKTAFYDRLGQVDMQVQRAEGYIDADKPVEANAYVDRNLAVLQMEGDAKRARKDMRAIRKARRANDGALEKGLIEKEAHESEDRVLDDAESIVVQNFNAAWNASMEAAGE
jgi:N12 class adenine-specific DNA methylase